MNYQFDLEKWMTMFPLQVAPNGRYYGNTVTSPCDVCNNEWLRKGMQDQYDWGRPVPTDLFVMAEGEPENRFATKIGGLPYRPASAPWPAAKNGEPLRFLAQFNFTDSVDIVGKQSRDLLLIFMNNNEGLYQEFHFEWQHIVDQPKLIAHVPDLKNPIAPCYGYRCRVNNFPYAKRKNNETEYPRCHGKDVWSDFHLLEYQGTQIGKSAFQPQPSNSIWRSLLCTISSVQPDLHGKFPLVNREQPLCDKDRWSVKTNFLMIGDLGCIFVCRNRLGKLSASDQCY